MYKCKQCQDQLFNCQLLRCFRTLFRDLAPPTHLLPLVVLPAAVSRVFVCCSRWNSSLALREHRQGTHAKNVARNSARYTNTHEIACVHGPKPVRCIHSVAKFYTPSPLAPFGEVAFASRVDVFAPLVDTITPPCSHLALTRRTHCVSRPDRCVIFRAYVRTYARVFFSHTSCRSCFCFFHRAPHLRNPSMYVACM